MKAGRPEIPRRERNFRARRHFPRHQPTPPAALHTYDITSALREKERERERERRGTAYVGKCKMKEIRVRPTLRGIANFIGPTRPPARSEIHAHDARGYMYTLRAYLFLSMLMRKTRRYSKKYSLTASTHLCRRSFLLRIHC